MIQSFETEPCRERLTRHYPGPDPSLTAGELLELLEIQNCQISSRSPDFNRKNWKSNVSSRPNVRPGVASGCHLIRSSQSWGNRANEC